MIIKKFKHIELIMKNKEFHSSIIFSFRGGVGPGGSGMQQMIAPKGVMMRPRAPMFARAEPEEITIEDDNDVPIVVPQQRVVPRAVARVGMRGGKGARRGRPRLDPDTDLGTFF